MRYQVLYCETHGKRFFDPEDVVDRTDYVLVATIEAEGPDHAFRLMNAVDGSELCCQLGLRSMSPGDLLVDEGGNALGCCGCGWKKVTLP